MIKPVRQKFRRRVARGNLTSGQLRRLDISSSSASPCSMLIQHRFAFLNLRPSPRIDESQEELSVPHSLDCKQNIVFQLLATGGSPGVIQRRVVGRRNGEMHKAGQTTGAPRGLPHSLHVLHGETVFVFPQCALRPSRSHGIKLYWIFFVLFRAFRG